MRLNRITSLNTALVFFMASLAMTLPAAAKKAPVKPKPFIDMIAPDAKQQDAEMLAMFKDIFGAASDAPATIEEQDYIFSPVAVQPIGNGIFALISMGQNTLQGHVQSGINVIHYVRKTETKYKDIGEYYGLGAVGTFGQPALRYSITNKLGKNPYLITQAGGSWQGYSCATISLTELTPEKPIERGSFASGYSNGGAVSQKRKQQNLDGVITSAVQDKSFVVQFSGTRKFTQTWVRGANEYILKGKSEVPAC